MRVLEEFKLRKACYLDDWTVAFSSTKNSLKVLAATIYILFTNVAPAVTFASFLISKTERQYGTIDILLSSGVNGVIYAIFSGQPLIIVGVTGPVSIFLETLYFLNKEFIKTSFLPLVFWIGLWAGLIHIALGLYGACSVVKYVTPYTCEVFGAFIGCIYIYTGCIQILAVFNDKSISSSLMTILLSAITILFCHTGSKARSWRSFTETIRGFTADYIVPFSIVAVTIIYQIPFLSQVEIDLLKVRPQFGPSDGRSRFLIDPSETPISLIFAAIIPAIILTTLIFFDHNVSALLAQQQHGVRLKKPSAYNWDFILVGILMSLTGLFGLPFTHGLIPQAPLHVLALSTRVEDEMQEIAEVDGVVDSHSSIIYDTVEQRVSNLSQSILTLLFCTVNVLLAALASIPVAVLNGLLIFMGLQAFNNNAFTSRLYGLLLVYDPEIRSTLPFWPSNVEYKKIRLFVISQFVMLIIIFAITVSPLAILFPVAISITVCTRMALSRWQWFQKSDLSRLDEDFADVEVDAEEVAMNDFNN